MDEDKKCGAAGCDKIGKHLCSRCGERMYCSKECQRDDWPTHKLSCLTATKPEAAAMLQSFKDLSITQLKNLVRAKAANFGETKKKNVLDKLNKLTEKPQLLRLVEEHVHPAEIEALLSGAMNPVMPGSMPGPSSGVSRRNGKGRQQTMRTVQQGPGPGLQPGQVPNADHVRRQAAEMRKNPDAVRRADKMFKNMSNKEIIEYADQIEAAAKDPAMFKQMMEMAQMPAKDRDSMQLLQQGLTGAVPRDEKWIKSIVKMVKRNPEMLKNMYKGKIDEKSGMTEAQIESFIDTIVSLPDWLLIIIGRAINWAVEAWPSIAAAYQKVDDWTLGCAKYIVLAVVFFFLFQMAKYTMAFTVFMFNLARKGYHFVMGSSSATAAPGFDASTVGREASSGTGAKAPADEYDF